jgi:hypothetical protein
VNNLDELRLVTWAVQKARRFVERQSKERDVDGCYNNTRVYGFGISSTLQTQTQQGQQDVSQRVDDVVGEAVHNTKPLTCILSSTCYCHTDEEGWLNSTKVSRGGAEHLQPAHARRVLGNGPSSMEQRGGRQLDEVNHSGLAK